MFDQAKYVISDINTHNIEHDSKTCAPMHRLKKSNYIIYGSTI